MFLENFGLPKKMFYVLLFRYNKFFINTIQWKFLRTQVFFRQRVYFHAHILEYHIYLKILH